MLGAVIGDIVGSVYEWDNIKTKDFPLFRKDCFFTDDTVMTIATAEALLKGGTADDFIDAYKKWGMLYPDAGYGGRFGAWLTSDDRNPYNSFGNGSAMRVAPCGWFAESLYEAEALAEKSAAVTHNHPEGIKGAKATAAAIYLARTGKSKADIKSYIEATYGYNLSRTLEEIRPNYKFNETCQETVPEAIIAFLESRDFEDAIRNAISLGGDSDTLAAITGSIAEAAYSVPSEIMADTFYFLDDGLSSVINRWLDAGKPIGAYEFNPGALELFKSTGIEFSQPYKIKADFRFHDRSLARLRYCLRLRTDDTFYSLYDNYRLCYHRFTRYKLFEAEIVRHDSHYSIDEFTVEHDAERFNHHDDDGYIRFFNSLLEDWCSFGRMIL